MVDVFAWSRGRALVASALPGVREVLNDGNSLLCEPEDVDAWAEALQRAGDATLRPLVRDHRHQYFAAVFGGAAHSPRALEAALAATPPDRARHAVGRLRALLSRWEDPDDGADDARGLDAVTADELFDILDDELEVSG